MEDDFIVCLKQLKEDWDKPFVPKPYVPPERPEVQLTKNQKRTIIEYVLNGVGKGLFEDCENFWENEDGSCISEEEIDRLYGSYRKAADEYVEALKQKLLQTL